MRQESYRLIRFTALVNLIHANIARGGLNISALEEHRNDYRERIMKECVAWIDAAEREAGIKNESS